MRIQVLDNSMFDNGCIECRTFILATAWGSEFCEFDIINRMFSPEVVKLIKSRLNSADSRYVRVKDQGITLSGEIILEIQWD